jgi:hypothetical protein
MCQQQQQNNNNTTALATHNTSNTMSAPLVLFSALVVPQGAEMRYVETSRRSGKQVHQKKTTTTNSNSDKIQCIT